MATILFASFPAEGHVNPKRPIVRELVRRGHDVLWYTGEQFADKIESAGAVRVPMREGRDLSPAATRHLSVPAYCPMRPHSDACAITR